MTGLSGFGLPAWFDVESPVAEVVGEVDVLTLNHHGNRDASNATFLDRLRPAVIIQQSWVSDHPGGEVLHRMIHSQERANGHGIFATYIADETKVALGPWMTSAYRNFDGHVLIRVSEGGATYRVLVLDDKSESLSVMQDHGPFSSRN